MADGFALRGFTQGFTQGLQNIDQLTTNWQTRDLRQKEVELQREQQDRQNRYNDYLIQNMERDNARLDRQQQVNEQSAGLDMEGKRNSLQAERMKIEQAQKQADLVRINDALTVGKVDDDTWGLMRKYGFDGFVGTDPGQLNQIADEIESGRRPPNDPEVMKVLNPVLTPAAMRNIGGEGVVPNTVYQNGDNPAQNLPRPGTPVRIATKKVVGYDQVNGKWVPRLQVQGADKQGNFVSYEAPFTQRASSDPDDPLMPMDAKDLANKLRGAAYVNQRIKADPTLQERLKGQVQDVYQGIRSPLSAKDQAYIADKQGQQRVREIETQIKAMEAQSRMATGQAKAEAQKALAELYKEKLKTEQSMQDKNWAAADAETGKGLGSVEKNSKATFDPKRAQSVVDQLMPIPPEPKQFSPDDPTGEKYQKGVQEMQAKRQEFLRTMQGLVTMSGMPQDEAEIAASTGQQELFTAKDGHTYWVVNTYDKKGNPIKVPFAQVK